MHLANILWVACGIVLLSVWSVTAVPLSRLVESKPHPLVIWHGLGDSAHSEGMETLMDELREAFPGLYVHSVSLDASESGDRKAGFFGDVNEQVEQVCAQLGMIDELRGGFDAIGFSQGGQFLRAYVERCNEPRVRNLVTFGSQHMGIADLPACTSADLLCRLAEAALRGGMYTDYAQSHIVSAQYFRNPRNPTWFAKYLEKNDFIKDINNERPYHTRNASYAKNLLELDNLVLIMFDQDTTVQPKQSSWFSSYPIHNSSSNRSTDQEPTPLRQSDIYLEDRIGLQRLDKRGALILELCHGVHMQIDAACQLKVFGKYVGTPSPSALVPRSLRHAWARTLYTLTGLHMQDTWAVVITQTGILGILAMLGSTLLSVFRMLFGRVAFNQPGQIVLR